MMRLMLVAAAAVMVGCAPSLEDGLYLEDLDASQDTQSEETARLAAMVDVQDALEAVDIAPELAWQTIDADATLMAAREEAKRDGCAVTGVVGGAWADEDNRFRGQVHRFDGPGAFVGGFYKGLDEDGGVWAGRWEGRKGLSEGNLGGLFSSSHRMRGKWRGDGGGHGRMIGAWKRVGPRGGAFFGVWAACP
jgi:hypothetical protein